MAILMATKLPSGALISHEEAAARVSAKVAAISEQCAQFCHCVDKPVKAKNDKQEQWAAQMARGRKNLAGGGYLAGHNPRSLPAWELTPATANTTASNSTTSLPPRVLARASPGDPPSPHPFRPHRPTPGPTALLCLPTATSTAPAECEADCYCRPDGTISCLKAPLETLQRLMKTRKADGRPFGKWEAQVFMRDFAGEMAERCGEWCFCAEPGPVGGLRGMVGGV